MISWLIVMKKPREVLTEVICRACDGTGFEKVKQPTEPGRKIYPAMQGTSRQGSNKRAAVKQHLARNPIHSHRRGRAGVPLGYFPCQDQSGHGPLLQVLRFLTPSRTYVAVIGKLHSATADSR